MPIVDIELVCANEREASAVSAAAIASALGVVFGSPPGRAWVRIRHLSSAAYAENEHELSPERWPVFVTVLLAHWPVGQAMAEQVREVTNAVAACLSISHERVHVQYAPPAAGRQAFGGRLVG